MFKAYLGVWGLRFRGLGVEGLGFRVGLLKVEPPIMALKSFHSAAATMKRCVRLTAREPFVKPKHKHKTLGRGTVCFIIARSAS